MSPGISRTDSAPGYWMHCSKFIILMLAEIDSGVEPTNASPPAVAIAPSMFTVNVASSPKNPFIGVNVSIP